MDDNSKQLIEIATALGELKAGQDLIIKTVLGNGNPGLVQKVEDLEASKNRVWGVGAAVTFLGGVAEWLIHRKP